MSELMLLTNKETTSWSLVLLTTPIQLDQPLTINTMSSPQMMVLEDTMKISMLELTLMVTKKETDGSLEVTIKVASSSPLLPSPNITYLLLTMALMLMVVIMMLELTPIKKIETLGLLITSIYTPIEIII